MDVPRDIKRSPTKKLQIRGFGVVLPNDELPDDLLQLARNVRIYKLGELRVRPGVQKISTNSLGGQPIHSLISLNDPILGAIRSYAILGGAATKLYSDDALHTAFTALQQAGVDLIFSGSKLSFAIVRPFQAADPWCYVGDSLLTRKVRSDSTNYPWGTAPPLRPLDAKIGQPIYKIISDFEAVNEGGVNWVATAPASALAAAARIAAIGITHILYDEGSVGWACVVPASFPTDIQAGMLITMSANVETVQIDNVYEQTTSTTIASISYDNVTGPGLCTIQPTIAVPNLKLNMMLRLAAAENVRILSVTEAPDGTAISFRCVTTAIRSAGDAIDGFRSFRTYFANNHTTAETFSTNCLGFQVAAGTGYIQHLLARDLSNVLNRPITDEDDFHISFAVDNPSLIQEIRLIFDLDPTINDFTHNALFKVFRPSDLTAAVTGSQTLIDAQRTVLSRAILERRQALINQSIYDVYYHRFDREFEIPLDPELPDPVFPIEIDPSTTQTGLGTNQWSELRFKRKDLERIGTDLSRDLRDVKGIRIQVLASGTVQVKVDALTLGGTYGPQSPPLDLSTLPYYYAYRYRSSITGTKSNFSPPIRSGVLPNRDAVVLTPSPSTDLQIDKIDYIRYGGALQEWQIIGTSDNNANPFTDTLPDSSLLGKKAVNLTDDFQPFPTIDLPRQGTCDVKGTTIKRLNGDQFNTSWSRNSEIYINGVRHTLYTSPTDIDTLELNENGGTQTNVTFYLPEPTIIGQPLPSIWGPFGGPIFGDVIFACGDKYQPGVMFYTSPGDPDSTRDIFQLEICSGSEKLLNGCLFRNRCYIASNAMWYEVIPRFGYGYSIVDNLGAFIAQDTANRKGLITKDCLAVGDLIYFASQDGIYAYDGGQEVSITGDLYPLFPHDGQPGQAITLNDFGSTISILPPDFTKLDKWQLEYYDQLVHFTYEDTGGTLRTLVYSTITKGWNSEDTFSPEMRTVYGVKREGTHQLLYGGKDGNLYQSTSILSDDNGTAIAARVRTGSDDLEDARVNKQIYEGWVDFGAATGQLRIGLDDFTVEAANFNPAFASRTKKLLDFNSGNGIVARNIGIDLAFSAGSIFAWQFSFAILPEDTILRATANWSDLGYQGAKRIQGIWIEADTSGQQKDILIQADGATVFPLSINHNGIIERYYPITPFIGTELRIIPNAAEVDSWRYFKEKFDAQPYPELSTTVVDFTDDGDPRPKWLQGFILEADTNGLDVQLQLQIDEGVVAQTFTINHNGREIVDYSLDEPVITHAMRLVPLGDVRIGAPFALQWRWEPEPPLVTVYETQPTTFDIDGFKHLGEIHIAHRSTGDVTMIITVDNVDYTYIIPNSGGSLDATRLLPQAVKGDVHSFRFQSAAAFPFRLYLKDSRVSVGEWGREGPYVIARPFGDVSRIQGATI